MNDLQVVINELPRTIRRNQMGPGSESVGQPLGGNRSPVSDRQRSSPIVPIERIDYLKLVRLESLHPVP